MVGAGVGIGIGFIGGGGGSFLGAVEGAGLLAGLAGLVALRYGLGMLETFSGLTWVLGGWLPNFLCLFLHGGCACTMHMFPDVDCYWDGVCYKLGLLLGLLQLLC